jgi:hypothetical protein
VVEGAAGGVVELSGEGEDAGEGRAGGFAAVVAAEVGVRPPGAQDLFPFLQHGGDAAAEGGGVDGFAGEQFPFATHRPAGEHGGSGGARAALDDHGGDRERGGGDGGAFHNIGTTNQAAATAAPAIPSRRVQAEGEAARNLSAAPVGQP